MNGLSDAAIHSRSIRRWGPLTPAIRRFAQKGATASLDKRRALDRRFLDCLRFGLLRLGISGWRACFRLGQTPLVPLRCG